MNAVRYFYVRADPRSAKARNDRVYHNAQCPKLAQHNLKSGTYEPVEQPPNGYRPAEGAADDQRGSLKADAA